MPNLIEKLTQLVNSNSQIAKHILADLEMRITELKNQDKVDAGLISRIANILPSYLSPVNLREWGERVVDLIKSMRVIPQKNANKQLSVLMQEAMEFPLDAFVFLQPSDNSMEQIRIFFDDTLREACRQLLEVDGTFNAKLITLLQFQSVLDKHHNSFNELRWGMVITVCLNLICMESLTFAGKDLGIEGIAKGSDATEASESLEQKEWKVKSHILLHTINLFMKDRAYTMERIEWIIKERIHFVEYAQQYIQHGRHDFQSIQNLNRALFKVESKTLKFFGSFFRKNLPQDDHILKSASMRYPEVAEHIFAEIAEHIQRGESHFMFAIKFLIQLNRDDLARRALHPNLKSDIFVGRKTDATIEEIHIKKAYRRLMRSDSTPTEHCKKITHRRVKSHS